MAGAGLCILSSLCSPVLVAPDANIDVCARRVIWAKCINAGQACLAPDHVLCLRDQRDKLVSAMKTTIAEFYGEVSWGGGGGGGEGVREGEGGWEGGREVKVAGNNAKNGKSKACSTL